MIDATKCELPSHFNMKDMRNVAYMMGVKILWDHQPKSHLSSHFNIKDIGDLAYIGNQNPMSSIQTNP